MVKFTQEIADEICLKTSCTSEGIRKLCRKNKHWPRAKTIYKWRLKYPAFGEQYARAKAFQAHVLADEIIEIADDTKHDYRLVGDKVVVDSDHINRARLRIDSRKWLLSKLLPKIYGDKVGEDKSSDNNSLLEKLIDKL
jgi:hypothetical protein